MTLSVVAHQHHQGARSPLTMNKSNTNTMNDLAFVSPKSNKAKNRFANLMNNQPECLVEQSKGNRFFLRSINGKNFFWVSINNDPDWAVEF